MKHSIVLVIGLLCAPLFAAKPAYFKDVKGVVLTGISGREDFTLNPGELSNCNSSSITQLTSFDCDVSAASAVVKSADGKSRTFQLTHLHVMYMYAYKQPHHDYLFTGEFSEGGEVKLASKVKLSLWHWSSTPAELQGSLSLETYGVSNGIAATATYEN